MKASHLTFMAIVFLMAIAPSNAVAVEPVIRFTDIDSGPGTGLGDGLGSGAIVTIWGQHLGGTHGDSTVTFTDVNGDTHSAAHVYYWTNADGNLPGGPADLYSSHRMQELAFSIPDVPAGVGTIQVKVGGLTSNSLPFTVSETGKIFWVAPNGNNRNPGTFSSPMAYINADIAGSRGGIANGKLNAGDIVYSRGVAEPEFGSGGRYVGLYLRSIRGTRANPISLIAYPNTQPTVVARDSGFLPYLSDHVNLSKFDIRVGHVDPSAPPNPGASNKSEMHIKTNKGRYVGNYLGQIDGTCVTGWAGAIQSTSTSGEGVKALGNEIDGLGCRNTSRFHHTTYMSVRSGDKSLSEAWEYSFNYLHDNFPMFGLHFYDEQINSGDCGGLSGTLIVTNNVITNQWGAAINIRTKDTSGARNACWSADILVENNVIINAGLGETLEDNVTPAPNAIRIGGSIAPDKITVRNNMIYEWGSEKSFEVHGPGEGLLIGHHSSVDPVITVENNVFKSRIDYPFVDISGNADQTRNNAFYSEIAADMNAIVPSWPANVIDDPALEFIGDYVLIDPASPLVNSGAKSPEMSAYDIYGNKRVNADIGAVESTVRPAAPNSLTAQ